MNGNTCRHVRREIDELEIGQQPGEQAHAHLAVCPACAEFSRERADLRDLVRSLEPVVAPADFDMRLRARIAAERGAARPSFFAQLVSTPAIAAAAAVVLLVGSIVWIAQRNTDQTTKVATENSSKQPTNQVASDPAKEVAPAPTVNTVSGKGDELVVDNGSNLPVRRKRPGRSTNVRDFSVMPANLIRQNDQAFVNAPSKPVVVSLKDDRGATRKISLPPVSFGAQSLVDNRIPVSYSANSRIW